MSGRAWRPTSNAWTGRRPRSPIAGPSSSRSGADRSRRSRSSRTSSDGIEPRIDLLEARRRDIEETAGSRFLASAHGTSDRPAPRPGERRAGSGTSARGRPRPAGRCGGLRRRRPGDRRRTRRRRRHLRDREGRAGRARPAGRARAPSVVEAEPAARGIASTVLRDVYLGRDRGGSGREAERAPGRVLRHAGGRPDRSRGDPHGEGGRRAGPRDPRGAQGAGARPGGDPERPEAEARAAARRSAPRSTFLQEQVDAADADITSAAERLSVTRGRARGTAEGRGDPPAARRRPRGRHGRVARAPRGRGAVAGRDAGASPHAATTRVGTGGGRDAPSRPIAARCAPPRTARRARRARRARSDPAARRAGSCGGRAHAGGADDAQGGRRGAGRIQRPRRWRPRPSARPREAEAEVNRAWREASTELDRLRETYEDEDRLRGDIERRIADAERLLREGHRREPEDALMRAVRGRLGRVAGEEVGAGAATVGVDRPRQPARDRGVRGGPGATRLHGARARRRAQGAARPARGDRQGRPGDLGDVRRGLPRRRARVRTADRGAVPRRLRASRPDRSGPAARRAASRSRPARDANA